MSYRKYNELGPNENTPKPSYQVMEIQNIEHKQDLLRKHAIVCIDVHANWCQPCKQLSPAYAVMAKEFSAPGKCILVKEDVEQGLSQDFEITAVPTFLIFYRGGFYKRITGADLGPVEVALRQLMSEFTKGPVEPTHPPVDPGFSYRGPSREKYHQQRDNQQTLPQGPLPGYPRRQGVPQGPPQQYRSTHNTQHPMRNNERTGPSMEQYNQGMHEYRQPPPEITSQSDGSQYRVNYGAQCSYDDGSCGTTPSPQFNQANRNTKPRR